jgi:phage-related protein
MSDRYDGDAEDGTYLMLASCMYQNAESKASVVYWVGNEDDTYPVSAGGERERCDGRGCQYNICSSDSGTYITLTSCMEG